MNAKNSAAAGERRRHQRRVAQQLAQLRAGVPSARRGRLGRQRAAHHDRRGQRQQRERAERDAPAAPRVTQRHADPPDQPARDERGDVVAHRTAADARAVRLGTYGTPTVSRPGMQSPCSARTASRARKLGASASEQRRHDDRGAGEHRARRGARSGPTAGPQNQAPSGERADHAPTRSARPATGVTPNSRPRSGRIACVEYIAANIARGAEQERPHAAQQGSGRWAATATRQGRVRPMQVAVVTGAGSGIGREVAAVLLRRRLARRARRPPRGGAARDRRRTPDAALVVPTDVRDPARSGRCSPACARRGGGSTCCSTTPGCSARRARSRTSRSRTGRRSSRPTSPAASCARRRPCAR